MTPFLLWFEEAKQVFGFCPCCNKLFRLSEVTVFTKSPPPRTKFDLLAERERSLEAKEQRLDAHEQSLKELAKLRGQAKARRRLKKIAPYFSSQAINPQDVKVLFEPVEYLIFKGLNAEGCSALDFVDHPAKTKERERVQKSLAHAIDAGNYGWRTFHVDVTGTITSE